MQLLSIMCSVWCLTLESAPASVLELAPFILSPLVILLVALAKYKSQMQRDLRNREERVREIMEPFRSDWERVRPRSNSGRDPQELMVRGIDALNQFKAEFKGLVPVCPKPLKSDIRKLGNASYRITKRFENGLLTMEEWEIQRVSIGLNICSVMRTLGAMPA